MTRPDDRDRHVHAVLLAMHEGVVAVDSEARVVDLNPAAERLTGCVRERAVGRPFRDVVRLERRDGGGPLDPIQECLKSRQARHSVQPDLLRPADAPHPVSARWRALPVEPSGAVLLVEDVTEQTLLSQELDYRTRHDPLTGLLNREEFEHRLRAALTDARERGTRYLMCYLDLDQFRLINETVGHFAGDEMLRELATALRARLRQGDVLARLGSDEFAALMPEDAAVPAREVIHALHEAVKGFSFEWDNRHYSPTVSIGVAAIHARSVSVARVLREADAACQAAKEEGRNRVRDADTEIERRHGEMRLVGQFTEALEQNRFTLFAEDVVPVADPTRVVYRELLVRLRADGDRLLMPSSFIQAAERYFLITAMDQWVFRRALDHLARRPDDGVIHAVNISGQSLGDSRFLDFVLQALDSAAVAPGRLCFEITETAAISRLTQATRFIRRLSDTGVHFSLDDFGTGMASFAYLKNLPVHFLKIDGTFVRSMMESRVDRGMVEAINRIGHEMGLRTIAEQVEDPKMLSLLASIGVDFVQGLAISRGYPLDEH